MNDFLTRLVTRARGEAVRVDPRPRSRFEPGILEEGSAQTPASPDSPALPAESGGPERPPEPAAPPSSRPEPQSDAPGAAGSTGKPAAKPAGGPPSGSPRGPFAASPPAGSTAPPLPAPFADPADGQDGPRRRSEPQRSEMPSGKLAENGSAGPPATIPDLAAARSAAGPPPEPRGTLPRTEGERRRPKAPGAASPNASPELPPRQTAGAALEAAALSGAGPAALALRSAAEASATPREARRSSEPSVLPASSSPASLSPGSPSPAPRSPAFPPPRRSAAAAETAVPEIRVHIGRVDVRAAAPPPAPSAPRRPRLAGPRMTLADYMAARRETR